MIGRSESERRIKEIEKKYGIKKSVQGIFGRTTEYGDGSKISDGLFGRSYYFADGTSVVAGLFGYSTNQNGEDFIGDVDVSGKDFDLRAEPRQGDVRVSNISRVRSGNSVSISDKRILINGKDYTDKIPRGANIQVVNDKVYANGKLIE